MITYFACSCAIAFFPRSNAMLPIVNQETVYDLIFRERWTELLDLVHVRRDSIEGDALLAHALDTFTEVFCERLASDGPERHGLEIEKLFLLHVGGFHRLPNEALERIVAHLVALHADRPEAAASYAKHYPSNPICARALARFQVRERVEHTKSERIAFDQTLAFADVDRTVPLFKSQQEVAFFKAAREVFATYLVYPNVALSTVFDFAAMRDELSSSERQYFFRGVIDCVIFDQHNEYRPLYFFELDSPLHDDEATRDRDLHKDRIVSVAGKKLFRLRASGGRMTRDELVSVLREVGDVTGLGRGDAGR